MYFVCTQFVHFAYHYSERGYNGRLSYCSKRQPSHTFFLSISIERFEHVTHKYEHYSNVVIAKNIANKNHIYNLPTKNALHINKIKNRYLLEFFFRIVINSGVYVNCGINEKLINQ